MHYKEIILNDNFTKHSFRGSEGAYFHACLHHLKGLDLGFPHSHPHDFRSHVLQGSYTERIYHIQPCGAWHTEDMHRPAGSTHEVKAATIHQIIDLPEGECWTCIYPHGPAPVDWAHWRFEPDGIYRRVWDEAAWQKYNPIKF